MTHAKTDEIEYGRRTGKTTRAVLQACLLASEGKSVVILQGTRMQCRDTLQKCQRVLEDLGCLRPKKDFYVRDIRIGDSGRIRAAMPGEDVGGAPGETCFIQEVWSKAT